MTNNLPEKAILVPSSLNSQFHYSPAKHQITWHGSLNPGAEKRFKYQLLPDKFLTTGTQLINNLTIEIAGDVVTLHKGSSTWINAPDLSSSQIFTQQEDKKPVEVLSYTIRLRNNGLAASEAITAVLTFPESLHPLTNTLNAGHGDLVIDKKKVFWTGPLDGGQTVTASLVVTRSQLFESWLPVTTIIEDGVTNPIILFDLLNAPPHQIFFPVFPHD